LRVGRGLTLAFACVALATVAHVAAGSGWPAHGPFVICAVLLAVACVALADVQRTLGAIAAVIVLTQPRLHVVLALSSHGSAAVAPGLGIQPRPALCEPWENRTWSAGATRTSGRPSTRAVMATGTIA
jgi:hypothetical protein